MWKSPLAYTYERGREEDALLARVQKEKCQHEAEPPPAVDVSPPRLEREKSREVGDREREILFVASRPMGGREWERERERDRGNVEGLDGRACEC